MQQDFLSDVELYYSSHSIIDDSILIDGEEAHHISHVMRHFQNDEIYLTDGNGSIYKSIISEVGKRNILARIIKTYNYENNFKNIYLIELFYRARLHGKTKLVESVHPSRQTDEV